MTMFLAPYTAIADIDGSPLDAGFIFFGEYEKDPELFPIEVFWDADFTVPAAQPIRTRNGYPVRNGSPTKVYLKTAQHSIVIKNRNSAFILVDFKNKGWDASFVVDGSMTQKQINDLTIQSIDNVSNIPTFKPRANGQIVYLKSYHPNKAVGWGYLKYDQAASDTANNVTSFSSNYGGLWRRQLKDPKEIYAVDGGVLFDGTTDNTVAFNRLCAMLTQESTLKLSHGTAITGAFELPYFGCKIIGADLTHSTIKLKTIADYIGWKDYCFFDSFRTTGAGFYAGESYLFKDTRPNKTTKSDCDVFWKNCYFSEAEFVTDGFGRGFKFDNCQDFHIRYAWLKADFPVSFVPNGSDNDTLETGFRGFIFKGCRRHYSPAYFLWNLGYNAQNLQGVEISDTWLEGGGRFVVGYMREAVITGTLGYHRNADWKHFELTGGENITITGNTFARLKGGTTVSNAFMTSANAIKGLSIVGNTFDGVDQGILRLAHAGETSQDITIANNTYIGCFSTGSGIFNITTGAVDGITVRESGIVAPSASWIPARRSASISVTNHKIDVNCSVSPYVHNFARGVSLGSTKKQGVYNGTGNTLTQNIVVGYEARMIRITGSDGTVCVLPYGTNSIANGITIGIAQDFSVTGNANKSGVTYFWETD